MITKFERVESVKNIIKTKVVCFDNVDDEVDEFEREDEQRQRALDDYGVVEEPESDIALETDMRTQEFGTDPDELRPMLNMSVNPDYSDSRVAEVVGKFASEVLCPTWNLRVARNFECLCGDIHR
jgi:hypothetical protein